MRINKTHVPQAWWTAGVRYGIAALVGFLAGGLTLLLPPVAEGTPFLFFYAAVTLSAWYGGFGPALLTILLAAGWSAYFALPSLHSLQEGTPADLLRLSLFLLVAVLISSLYTRQQRAAAAERLQREYWQAIFASIGYAVIVTDAHGNMTEMNPVAQRLIGCTLDAAQGKPLPEVFRIHNEETRQPVEDPVATVLRTGTVAGLANHTVLCTKDGRELPIDDSAAPIRDVTGRLQGIVLVFRDITERRQEEAALQDSHALLSAIIEGIPDAVFVKDRQGRYVMINTVGAQWLGRPVGEVLGRTDAELFAPESVPAILTHNQQRVLTTGESQAYEHTGTAGGSTRTYHSVNVPYCDRHGAIAGVIGIARDISERTRIEEALRLSESRYRTISDLVSDYAYAVRIEADGRAELEWVTGAFHRITGFTKSELAEHEGLAWLIHPEDMPSVQRRLQVLFAGQPGVSEHRIITKSGEVRWLQDYSSPEWDAAQGRIVRIIGAGQDITARKQAEEERAQLFAELQRVNAELHQFAYIVSHDLREPLHTIASLLSLLATRYQGKLDATADKYINFAVDGANRMQQMIRDLLAYTHAGGSAQKVTAVDCEAVLTQVVNDLQVTITEQHATITHDSLPTVAGDPLRLRQVFQNLLSNALKFRGAEPPRVHVSAQYRDGHWQVAVRDNGIGIDLAQAGRLFQVFQRLHRRDEYPGTGIGLAICKRIIEQCGGRIWVESEPGQGTTFFFTLPAM